MRTPETAPAGPAGPAGPVATMAAPATMSLAGHLTELRNRLIWCLLAIAAGGSVGFYFGDPIIDGITAPIPPHVPIILAQIGPGLAVRLQIALVVGIILAMPVILWHVWRFVAPGLTPSERRAVLPWIPAALVFFTLGVGVAYVVMPFAAQFLLSFLTDRVQPMLDLTS